MPSSRRTHDTRPLRLEDLLPRDVPPGTRLLCVDCHQQHPVEAMKCWGHDLLLVCQDCWRARSRARIASEAGMVLGIRAGRSHRDYRANRREFDRPSEGW